MSDAAYFLSWSSVHGQRGWTATLRYLDDAGAWSTLLEREVFRVGSCTREMMRTMLADRGLSTDARSVGWMHDRFELSHRIPDAELTQAIADMIGGIEPDRSRRAANLAAARG